MLMKIDPLAAANVRREATVLVRVEDAFARSVEAWTTRWAAIFPPLITILVSSKFMTAAGPKW